MPMSQMSSGAQSSTSCASPSIVWPRKSTVTSGAAMTSPLLGQSTRSLSTVVSCVGDWYSATLTPLEALGQLHEPRRRHGLRRADDAGPAALLPGDERAVAGANDGVRRVAALHGPAAGRLER